MRILITGASGFVGGSFIRRFANRKDVELFGIARRPLNLKNYRSVDLSRPFDLAFNPDVVIHAAARASPWGTRVEFHKQNVVATQNVIDYCRRNGHPRLIYVSSSSVFYREEHQFNITEASPIGPNFVNEYAATKFAGEVLVGGYTGEHLILRPRAVFGPGDTVLFPRILAAAKKGTLPLFIGQSRPVIGDLIYIDTLVDYIFRAATMPRVAGSYNLTNERAVEVQKFLLSVLQRLNIPVPTRRVSVNTALAAARLVELIYRACRLRSEPPVTRFGVGVFAYSKTFDIARTLVDLGPPSVELEEGVNRFVAWQRNQWGT